MIFELIAGNQEQITDFLNKMIKQGYQFAVKICLMKMEMLFSNPQEALEGYESLGGVGEVMVPKDYAELYRQ